MRTSNTVGPLLQRMIEDMTARNLGPHTQRSHVHSCRRFAAFFKRSPDTATALTLPRRGPPSTPEELAAQFKAEMEKWTAVIRDAKISLD